MNIKEMKELTARLVAMIEAEINSNNEKSEVIQNTLTSRMDTHQARTLTTQAEMKAKMDILQVRMKATVHSVQSKFEETVKHRVEDILSGVVQMTQGLQMKLNEKINETQVDLQAVKAPIDMWTWSLNNEIMDKKKDFHKAIANTRNDLHEELGLMIHGKAQMTKTLPNRYNVARTRGKDSRSRGLGRARKRNRHRHKHGEATKAQRDYIKGRFLAPVRDHSRAQLLHAPEEIHILDHRLAGKGGATAHATQSPKSRDL
jgi:hypothetical protein